MNQARSQILIACNVYVSEGRNRLIIQQLENLGQHFKNAFLANVFTDSPYNRSNFTIVSRSPEALATAAATLAESALGALDMRSHIATHPRLGVVDHISCHPLRGSLDNAAASAKLIGQHLGGGALQGTVPVPVYLYGHAHPEGLQLDELRRRLGYFKTGPGTSSSESQQQWKGALQAALSDGSLKPDFGPEVWPDATGVCCVGAVPWIVNFNILLDTQDVASCRQIARAVSGRNGGIPGVQAMALQHEQGVEIACNLLSHSISTAGVQSKVAELAAAQGMSVRDSYVIGKTIDQLIAIADQN